MSAVRTMNTLIFYTVTTVTLLALRLMKEDTVGLQVIDEIGYCDLLINYETFKVTPRR